MTQFIQAVALGVLIGGIYALMASGLTLIFGVLRIVNIAQGAFLILVATFTWWLWHTTGIDPILASVITTPLMFGLGWALHRFVIWRISGSPPSMAVLLTFGLALVVEGVLNVVAGNRFRSATPSYFEESFRVGGILLPKAQTYGFLAAVVVLGALYLVLTRTWTGRAIRATSQNPSAAALVGISAASTAALAFALGSASAGVGGSILSTLYPFFPASHYDWIARLLGIVVLGGLGSLPGALVGALTLGLAETLTATRLAAVVDARLLPGDHGRPAGPPAGHLRRETPGGRGMTERSERHDRQVLGLWSGREGMTWRKHLIPGIVLLALLLYPVVNPWYPYPQGVMLLAFLLAIQASGWNIISGYAGYISLGHSMFLGLGSYTAAIIALHTGVNPLWVAPLGGVVAVIVAVVAGAVVLRTRGHAFVIITIALLLAAQIVATNWKSLTNGSDGITLELPFWDSDIQNIPFYYLFLGLLVLTVLFSAWIARTKLGTGLVAIREDEGKAASIGVNTTIFKILAYAASAFFIGAAGGVYAYFQTFLNPVGSFAILGSVLIVLSALLGGRGTLYGPVLGAFIVSLLSEGATVFGGGNSARVLLLGSILVAVVLFLPAGLLPTIGKAWRKRHPIATEFTDQSGALAVAASTAVRSFSPDAGPLLEVRGITKRFGGLTAVDHADLVVRQGSITGLIGPNGSGKTTLFNLITGTFAADEGTVVLAGERIDKLKPWTRGHRGLGRTFQVTRLFKDMTVLQNVVAPLPDSKPSTIFKDAVSGAEADRARELLDIVGLGRFGAQKAGSLSYGQQKLVELAQVLMLQPRLILLDEPAGGVNPSLLGRLTEVIRELNASGVTFLVVEHNIPLVLDLCDEVHVFARGKPIASGPPGAIRNDPVVLDAYLGDDWRIDAHA